MSTVAPWTVTRLKSAPIARTSSSFSTATNALALSIFLKPKRFGTITGSPVSAFSIASSLPSGDVQPTEYCVSASERNWFSTEPSLARNTWPALAVAPDARMLNGFWFICFAFL